MLYNINKIELILKNEYYTYNKIIFVYLVKNNIRICLLN